VSGRLIIVKEKEVLVVEQLFDHFSTVVGVGASPGNVSAVKIA
jgi:hypothetical protein